jgi:hypothetical protein
MIREVHKSAWRFNASASSGVMPPFASVGVLIIFAIVPPCVPWRAPVQPDKQSYKKVRHYETQ